MKFKNKLFAALTLIVALLAAPYALAQETASSSAGLLALKENERYWWLNGAILTTAQLVGMHDRLQGECIARWYRGNRQGAQTEFEDMLSRYIYHSHTTVLLMMLSKACGDLSITRAQ